MRIINKNFKDINKKEFCSIFKEINVERYISSYQKDFNELKTEIENNKDTDFNFFLSYEENKLIGVWRVQTCGIEKIYELKPFIVSKIYKQPVFRYDQNLWEKEIVIRTEILNKIKDFCKTNNTKKGINYNIISYAPAVPDVPSSKREIKFFQEQKFIRIEKTNKYRFNVSTFNNNQPNQFQELNIKQEQEIIKKLILEFINPKGVLETLIPEIENNINIIDVKKNMLEIKSEMMHLNLNDSNHEEVFQYQNFYDNHNFLKEIGKLYYHYKDKISFSNKEIEFFKKVDNYTNENPLKLFKEEDIIHFIWIGPIPKSVARFLKIWSIVNPKMKINFYYHENGYLLKTLNDLIKIKSKWNKKLAKNPPSSIIDSILNLQDNFFKKYKYEKTIDENVKRFILYKKWMEEKDIDGLIEEFKKDHSNAMKGLANVECIEISEDEFHNDECFSENREYRYKMYLQELLLRQNFACASDILRYEVLFKNGGYYLDLDVLPSANLKLIPYITEEISKNFLQIVEKDKKKLYLFVNALMFGEFSPYFSLNKKENNSYIENIFWGVLEILELDKNHIDNFPLNFRLLKSFLFKVLENSFLNHDENYIYCLSEKYKKFEVFTNLIHNSITSFIKKNSTNDIFLPLTLNMKINSLSQCIIQNLSLLKEVVWEKDLNSKITVQQSYFTYTYNTQWLISKKYSKTLKNIINKVIDNYKIIKEKYTFNIKNINKELISDERKLLYYRLDGLNCYCFSNHEYTIYPISTYVHETYKDNKLLNDDYFNCYNSGHEKFLMCSNIDIVKLNNESDNYFKHYIQKFLMWLGLVKLNNESDNYIPHFYTPCFNSTFEENFSTWMLISGDSSLQDNINNEETNKLLMQSLTIEDISSSKQWNEYKKEELNSKSDELSEQKLSCKTSSSRLSSKSCLIL